MVKFKFRSPFTWERTLLLIGVVPSGPIWTLRRRDKSRALRKIRQQFLRDMTLLEQFC